MGNNWDELNNAIRTCTRCGLHSQRTNVVIGDGNVQSPIMFIGEGPGADEDRQGVPFVGAAGQLLNRILAAAKIPREAVYICNIVKCRPPNNRTPHDDEAAACIPYLREQYKLIKPRIIVCLGSVAARNIISPDMRITRDRGRWIQKKGVWMIATYHPAALLRDETKKRPVWDDFKSLMAKMDELGIVPGISSFEVDNA